MRKVGGVVPGDVGVVVRELRADQLAVDPLEVVVALAVDRVDDEIEVAGVHARAVAGPGRTISYGPRMLSGGQHRGSLRARARVIILSQHTYLPVRGIEDDVRAVDHLRRV